MDYTPDNKPNSAGQPMGNLPQGNNQAFQGQAQSPAEIYNASINANGPQYHYGAPQSFFDPRYIEQQRQKMLERSKHEKNLRMLGTNTGLTLLIVLAFSFVFSLILYLPGLYKLYETNLTFASAFGIFYSAISVGLAFFIGSFLFKRSKSFKKTPYNPPKDKTKAFLLVLIGFGGCLVANYITVFFRAFMEGMGVYSDYTALQDPSSTLDVIMIFIGSAIVPPLFEEFAIRGVLMQSLRKYGDAFAIITSAFVFGIFHGNVVQIPFAFLCGLFIGYAVIATESLWTGVIIHGLMNAMSAISSGIIYYYDEYASNTFFYIASAVGIVFGILALIAYMTRYKFKESLKDTISVNTLSPGEKFAKFSTSPIMVIAIIIYIINAITQLTTAPPTY